MYKILVESDTGSGAVFQKTYPKLIYLERVFKNLYAGNEHFSHNSFLSKHNKWSFSKEPF